MRRSTLGSFIVVPVLFTLATALGTSEARAAGGKSAPAAASPASDAPALAGTPAKRIAKRGKKKKPASVAATPAAYESPDPPSASPSSSSIASAPAVPSAPPVAAAPASPTSTTTTSSASMATTAPVAPLAEAPIAPPPVAEVSPTGIDLAIGSGLLVPATSLTSDDGARLGPGLTLEGRVGYYFIRHLGVVSGFRASIGHHVKGCDADSCSGVSVQIPVVLEIAASHRARGFYGAAGVGLFTTYAATAGDTTARLHSPLELKLGVGYRLGNGGKSAFDRMLAIDINLGADVGRVTSADLQVGSNEASGSIDNPTVHVVVALGVSGHFSL